MHKYYFAKRLKRIVDNECEIVKAENKIAHKSAKYYEQMSFLTTMLQNQEQELAKYRKEINKLKRENDRLEKCKQQEEERLCIIMKKVQVNYQPTLQEQIVQRRTAQLQIDCIRSIKQATQTYINLNALPELVQGVTICERKTSSEWKPFCIDPLKHTQEEVQHIIWDDTQVNSIYRESWEKLILAGLLHDTTKSAEMEPKNADVTVVI